MTAPVRAYQEQSGLLVMEAEHFGERTNGLTQTWLLKTSQSGYTGMSYLQPLPDIDTLYQTSEITASPQAAYPIDFTTPGTYTVWLRGYPTNAASDSVYVGLAGQVISVTGFAPNTWGWASESATLAITSTGVSTVNVWMREDGLRLDRLLLTTDTTYIPTGFGPLETERQIGGAEVITPLTRTIVYIYDNLYRLTGADYTTGESYSYSYDPVGNRLQQIINGNTTSYQYDAANRLAAINGQNNTFDANGNLLRTNALTNTFDAANRLVSTQRATSTLQPIYNGVGDRVAQTVGTTTTNFALDVLGLPEVIYTSAGDKYLHLSGVIMAESSTGEIRYLLSDGLGSVRQAVNETGAVVAYHEFDPYGNPVDNDGDNPYGFTGEWWQSDVGLLHLRARWYAPETGTFLSWDPMESEPPYLYVRGNPVNRIDPSGFSPERDEAGIRYTYSCNCGWIDWAHASAREYGLVTAIDQYQTKNWGWDSLSAPLIGSGEAGWHSNVTGEILVSTNLSNRLELLKVALGIFISKENLFEAHQGAEFFRDRSWVDWFKPASSFAEEDLISNLIGFHRGLFNRADSFDEIGRSWQNDVSGRYFARACGVVGLNLKLSGREAEFIEKQQQIFDQYGNFEKVSTWGKPRLGVWKGSIEIGCNSVDCKNPKVPSDLLWLEPEPPFPFQSTKATWTWISAKAHLTGFYDKLIFADDLNRRPLHWLN